MGGWGINMNSYIIALVTLVYSTYICIIYRYIYDIKGKKYGIIWMEKNVKDSQNLESRI